MRTCVRTAAAAPVLLWRRLHIVHRTGSVNVVALAAKRARTILCSTLTSLPYLPASPLPSALQAAETDTDSDEDDDDDGSDDGLRRGIHARGCVQLPRQAALGQPHPSGRHTGH